MPIYLKEGRAVKQGLKQISEITGFSLATVSNALSGNRGVNPETLEKVRQAAIKTGYLSEKKLRQIKLIHLQTGEKSVESSPFYTSLLNGVSSGCTENSYDLSYYSLNKSSSGFAEQLQRLSSDLGSAFILIGTEMTREEEKLFSDFTQPMLTLDYWCESRSCNGVDINNYDAGRKIANFLLEEGHSHIGYLQGKLRFRAFCERWRGVQSVFREHGLACSENDTVRLSMDMDTAYQDMKLYLSKKPILPTAFIADDDRIALGVMKALQEEGIGVPDRVSVIGFDNLPYCSISTPSLTSMEVPAYEMGLLAVRRLREVIENKDPLVLRQQVSAILRVRDSVRKRLPEENVVS